MKRIVFLFAALLLLASCLTSTEVHYQSDQREFSMNRTMDTSRDQ